MNDTSPQTKQLKVHYSRDGLIAVTETVNGKTTLTISGVQRWVDRGMEVDVTTMHKDIIERWLQQNFPRITPIRRRQILNAVTEYIMKVIRKVPDKVAGRFQPANAI